MLEPALPAPTATLTPELPASRAACLGGSGGHGSGTGDMRTLPPGYPHTSALEELPSVLASCGLTLWAEPGGCCWGCSHLGLPPMLQPFKLFVLQELSALQAPSLCPWGGLGTAVQSSQGHGTFSRQHLSVLPLALCKAASLPTAGLSWCHLPGDSSTTVPTPCFPPPRAPGALPHWEHLWAGVWGAVARGPRGVQGK